MNSQKKKNNIFDEQLQIINNLEEPKIINEQSETINNLEESTLNNEK